MASLTVSGAGSGLDINSIVSQLVEAERAPQANRLASKEARIQAQLSAFGTLKSSLEAFQNSLTKLQNIDTYNQRSSSLPSDSPFSVSVDDTAAAGSYEVSVEQLATRNKIASAPYADAQTSVGTGTLSITVNGESFSVDVESGSDSLEAIRAAINDAEDNVGVSASIVNDENGAQLVLTSDNSGVENAIAVSVTTDLADTGDLSQLSYDPNAGSNPMIEKVAALDSIIEVDGFTQTSSDLTVAGMIEGVTFNLSEARPGEKINVDVSLDTNAVKRAVEGFVKAYNNLNTTLNDLTAYDPEANTAGLLQGDSTTREIATRLRSEIGLNVGSISGDINSLAQIGITTGDNSLLEIDSDELGDVISSNFSAIQNLFANDDGYANRLDNTLERYTQGGGILDVRTEGLSGQIERINDQREALDRRIASVEERYFKQFTALDSLLGQLTSTGDFLNQQLANLPGSVRKES